MTHFEAYLLTRLDSLGLVFTPLIVMTVLIIIALLFVYIIIAGSHAKDDSDEPKCKKLLKYIKIAVSLLFLWYILKSLIPTTKEMAFIYIAPAIVNNQDLQDTMKKLPNISKLGLEYIEESLKSEINDKINTK